MGPMGDLLENACTAVQGGENHGGRMLLHSPQITPWTLTSVSFQFLVIEICNKKEVVLYCHYN